MNTQKLELPSVAEFVHTHILQHALIKSEVARRVGYRGPRMLSAVCEGTSTLAMDKIPDMASALGIPANTLFEVWMQENHPTVWKAVGGTVLHQPLLTQAEITEVLSQRQSRKAA